MASSKTEFGELRLNCTVLALIFWMPLAFSAESCVAPILGFFGSMIRL